MGKTTRKHPRVYAKQDKNSMTKQSFKDECNINNIMAKFQKTGAITHYANRSPEYGDCTPVQLQDALNTVAHANEMFDELPSSIRKKFHNDPQEFLEFVQNKDNLEEMRELGLANKAEKSPLPKTSVEDAPEESVKPDAASKEK